MIERYSSRRHTLGGLLPAMLTGAHAYDRIAGYFSSSILELAGEPIDRMAANGHVRVICNSELNALDVLTARAAKEAMYSEWCRSLPDDLSPELRTRLEKLYLYLSSGKVAVRVLPDSSFGLIHGKAGVITRADGSRIAFLGSVNESRQGWEVNYEILWTDVTVEGVQWTQCEFDALWNDPHAFELAEAVVKDANRLAHRTIWPDVASWSGQPAPNPASAAIELPVYRRENGLWAHQKYFIQVAFDLHKRGAARLVLADQVGLGKTVQLGLAAKLMALWGGGNVLVVAPKTLLGQWQTELWELLRVPCAVWTSRGWEDEHGVTHPESEAAGLRRCPRRVGLVSSGLVTQSPDAAEVLTALNYECVVVDEAHRARRRNLGPSHSNERPDPNNLLRFLRQVAGRTKSLLLATATPVQVDPIEAWDLLDVLNIGCEAVLGTRYSRWETRARSGLAYVLGRETPPSELHEAWEWMRDPVPPSGEGMKIQQIRRALSLTDGATYARAEDLDRLKPPDRRTVEDVARSFFPDHNPYIRHIIRRTREFLETTLNPETHEPYLKPVRVRLYGEDDADAVTLPTFLGDAYKAAAAFCIEVGRRPGLSSGFLKTILLRRIGSTIVAGKITVERMLRLAGDLDEEDDAADPVAQPSSLYPLSDEELRKLEKVQSLLNAWADEDPKYRAVEEILFKGVQGTGPWIALGSIVFTQYFDSATWIAKRLSERIPDEDVGLFTGERKSGVFRAGAFATARRESLKEAVRRGAMRLLVGTDAAAEGLNLQRLGSLINLDLPWNPTRLEQRKGRVQRIGQVRDEVLVYNLRYRGSVEDRVHQILSERLRAIRDMFGQLPDTLEDAWVAVALQDNARASEIIDQIPESHPFAIRYDRIEPVDWESCTQVLLAETQQESLLQGWRTG